MARHRSKRLFFHHRRPRVQLGAAPGTIAMPPDLTPPEIEAIAYGPDGLYEQKLENLKQIPALQEQWPTVWIHVQGLGDAELIKELGTLFSLHALALEDIINRNQRPKVEPYDDHLYIVAKSVAKDDELDFGQVNLFLGAGFVLTLQERKFVWRDSVRDRIRAGRTRIRRLGADYLCYALLDSIVDQHFPVIGPYGELLETMEGEAFAASAEIDVARIHGVRNALLSLRRPLASLEEVAMLLAKEDIHPIKDETRLYFRDLADHITHLVEVVDGDREIARSLVDLSLSVLSTRMNEVMKVLTIIATIFIPLGFIAGLYGMNFNPEVSPYNLPELNWYFGYPFALLLMLATVVGLLFFFRHKGWFDSPR